MRHGRGMMLARRLTFLALALPGALVLPWLLWGVLAPGGWGVLKAGMLLCLVGTAPWFGLGVAHAVLGFAIRRLARDPARAVVPPGASPDPGPITARTAIGVAVRNEAIGEVVAALAALREGLAAEADRFGFFVLSDTDEAAAIGAEAAAMAAAPAIGYRRRAVNAGFKAGNVMEFLDRHAGEFDFAVVLDADSRMSADAVRRLVRILQGSPSLALVQHLTVGRPAAAAFPRLFQFGMRAGMRIWATGQAWWQGDAGPFWGHNAILRIAPFRAHCRLPALPDGRTILSHDQVEAALLRGAGWGVCVWAAEEGSQEENPPALPEFIARDARWLAGNMQYRHLLGMPGLAAMGRWQLVQAMLLFSGAPLSCALLLLAALAAAGGMAVPRDRMLGLTLAWLALAYAPKLLGYLDAGLDGARPYGGRWRFALGAAAEFGFSLLLDAIMQPSRVLAMAAALPGRRQAGWGAQNRAARGVGWGEAARLLWPHTLLGAVAFAGLARGSWLAALWALPVAGGLLVAIPFAVATSRPALSDWLRARGIAALPEEIRR
ncbi:MAG: glucans biosynthesis glucosyltransferase MdoH [Rhodospirillales bacterium]|nr:glucans biosynthesis glucosyltransferase MdoH [Rhodospirillales bacterium]